MAPLSRLPFTLSSPRVSREPTLPVLTMPFPIYAIGFLVAIAIVSVSPALGQMLVRPLVNATGIACLSALLFATRWIPKAYRRWTVNIATGLLTIIGALLLFPATTRDAVESAGTPPSPAAASLRAALEPPLDGTADAKWQAASFLVTASRLAYATDGDARRELHALGFESVDLIKAGSNAGFVASLGDLAVVSFEGTNGFTDVGDWLFNLDSVPVPMGPGKVHRGFRDAWASLAGEVGRVLAARGIRRVWITGHSLGGAIALLAAMDLAERPAVEILGVMTFGQPLVFDEPGARAVGTALGNRFVRFVNEDDIVPRVAPGYWPGGRYVWIHEGKVFTGPVRSFATTAAVDGDGDASERETVDPGLMPLAEEEFEREKARFRAGTPPVFVDGEPAKGALPNVTDHDIARYEKAIETHVAELPERHP